MIFLDLSYRVLEAQRRKIDKDLKVAARSALLLRLLDQGYLANQVLAIRRLLDKGRDVISVRRLLDDISRNRRLLTREIYVCHDGLPYDPDGWQTLPQSVEMKIWGLHASGASHYLGAHFRHETFDRLSGVLPANRWRNDQIKDSVFVTLRSWLETTPAERIIRLSHKFFAHAADASSRVSLQYSGIKLADIQEIHRAIIRVERAITDKILFIAEARDVVPMPPLDLLHGLDYPYVPAASIQDMLKHWDQLSDERNKWPSEKFSEL